MSHVQHQQQTSDPTPLLGGHHRDDRGDYHDEGRKSWFQSWAGCIVGFLILAVIGLIVAVAVVANRSSSNNSPTPSVISANLSSQIYSMRDTSLDPCDDFFQYACNGWFQQNPLLSNDTDSYFYSFTNIQKLVYKQQLDIIGGHFPFITTFYDECRDMDSIDKRNLTDISALFKQVNQGFSLDNFLRVIGSNQANGLASTAFFSISVAADNLYADVYRAYLSPSGISAPKARVYNNPLFRSYFQTAVTSTFLNAGLSNLDATKAGQLVLDLEWAIANITLSLPDVSDQGSLINNTIRLTVPQLINLTKIFDFNSYFLTVSDTTSLTSIDVVCPTYFTQLGALLNNAFAKNSAQIAYYIKWHLLFGSMQYLPAPFRAIANDLTAHGFSAYRFQSSYNPTKELLDIAAGYRKQTPFEFGKQSNDHHLMDPSQDARDTFCVASTIEQFSDLVSHEWVMKDFSNAQRELASTLVQWIYQGIGDRIKNVDWLDNTTRSAAMDKWGKIVRNVGYSNDWLDYTTLKQFVGYPFPDLQSVNYFMNVANNQLYLQPVDRTQMPTRDYMIQNAFYNPSTNNINLLGGLMFPPFFDVDAPMMLNLAAYGMVIGHEITHGFDNQGRLFNGTGAYINWWTETSDKEFNQRAQCLIDQYSSYTVNTTEGIMRVNGTKTLGENIADHGGINVAYASYQKYAAPANGNLLKDITNDQLFFLYYAQNWCAETSLAFNLLRLKKDVHSPARWRVNGPLSNKKEFAQAYGCSADSNMGRSLTSKQCVLW